MNTPDLTTFDGARTMVRDACYNLAKDLVEIEGGIDPQALVIGVEFMGKRDGEPHPFLLVAEGGWEDPGVREGFSILVRRAVTVTKAAGVVFMSEAWLVNTPLAAEDPGRREVVVFSLEHGRNLAVFTAEIVRGGDRATLGPLEEAPQGGAWIGRFVNLMGRPQAEA